MVTMFFLEEAEDCRRKALAYVGHREASFLMSVARAFEDLAAETDYGLRVVARGNEQ